MPSKITNRSLEKELSSFIIKEVIKKSKPSLQKTVFAAFEKIKDEMIQEFNDHLITKEIASGPQSSNISGTLQGNGNLFSFIGFEKNSNPIKPILDLIEKSKIEYNRSTDSGIIFTIFIPSKNDIFKVTPMPWANGRSWAEGIERGISGLGQFLYTDKAETSRSGEGIQSKGVIKGGKYKPVQYISALLKKYEKKFLQIDSKVVISKILWFHSSSTN